MIAAEMLAVSRAALAERRAAELAAPDDQRLVEQAALLEVVGSARRRAGPSPHSVGPGCRGCPRSASVP